MTRLTYETQENSLKNLHSIPILGIIPKNGKSVQPRKPVLSAVEGLTFPFVLLIDRKVRSKQKRYPYKNREGCDFQSHRNRLAWRFGFSRWGA